MLDTPNKLGPWYWFERDYANEEWSIGCPLSEKWPDNGYPHWYQSWNWLTDVNDSLIRMTKWKKVSIWRLILQ